MGPRSRPAASAPPPFPQRRALPTSPPTIAITHDVLLGAEARTTDPLAEALLVHAGFRQVVDDGSRTPQAPARTPHPPPHPARRRPRRRDAARCPVPRRPGPRAARGPRRPPSPIPRATSSPAPPSSTLTDLGPRHASSATASGGPVHPPATPALKTPRSAPNTSPGAANFGSWRATASA
ncbi:hypothetical protein ACU686_37945 [Yinghuangia aomiensis]